MCQKIKLNYRTHHVSLQNKEDYLLRLDKHPRSECTCDEVEFNCTYIRPKFRNSCQTSLTGKPFNLNLVG